MNRDGGAMTSVTQWTETLRQILEEEANVLAKESGFIQRERVLSGADFAQTLIFGWLGEAEAVRRGSSSLCAGMCSRENCTGQYSLMGGTPMPRARSRKKRCQLMGSTSGIRPSLSKDACGSGISAKQATDGITSCDCQWEPRSTPEVGIVLCCRDSCRSRREPAWNWACWLVNGRAYPHA